MRLKTLTHTLLLLALMSQFTLQDCCPDKCFDQIRKLAPSEKLNKISAKELSFLTEKDLCGQVFKANGGSCVEYSEVKRFANAAFERMKVTFKKIIDFKMGAKATLEGSTPLFEAFTQKNPTGSTPDDTFVTCVGGSEGYKKINSFVLSIQEKSDEWKKNLEDASIKDSECFKLIFERKLGSFCLAVSNGAQKFYSSADSKFVVKKDFGIPLVNTCRSTLLRVGRINALIEVVSTIRSCLESTDLRPLDSKFSVDKLSFLEEADSNPEGVIADQTKLSKFCQEVGFVDYPKSTNRAEGKYTNANAITEEAKSGFKAPLEREVQKNQAIKNETIKRAETYDSSKPGGVAATLEAKKTDLNNLQTARTSYDSAIGTLKTSTSATEIKAARIVRRDFAKKDRNGYNTQIRTAVTEFDRLINDDLKKASNTTVLEAKMAIKKKIQDFLGLLDKATELNDKLKNITNEIQPLEEAANGGPIDKTKEDNYKESLDQVASIDVNVKTTFDEIEALAKQRFTEKKAEVDAEAAKIASNIEISQKRAAIAQTQLQAEAEKAKLREIEKAKLELDAKFAALDGMKTQLANPPAIQDVESLLAKYTDVKSKITEIKDSAMNATNQTNTNSSSQAAIAAVRALNQLCISYLSKLTQDISMISLRLTQGDSTATNLQSSLTSLDTQKAQIQTNITAKKALLTQLETANKDAEATNQLKLSELETKKAAFTEINDKASMELALLTGIAQENARNRSMYESRLKVIMNDIASCNKTNMTYCNSANISQYQQFCANNTQKLNSLYSTKSQTEQARDSAMAPLDASYAAKNQTVTPLLASRNQKRSELDYVNLALKTNQDAIRLRTGQIEMARNDLRNLENQLISIVQKKDLQQGTTTSFDSDVRAKLDEQRSIQLQFINTTKNSLIKICTPAETASGSTTGIGQAFKGLLPSVESGLTETATRLTEHQSKVTALTTAGSQITTSIVNQRTSVDTKIQQLATNRTNTTTAYTASQTRLSDLDQQIASQGPPRPSGRLLQVDSDSEGDVKIDDTNGASSSAIDAGVTVSGDLSSTETYSGANDAVPGSNGGTSDSFSSIFTTGIVGLISYIAFIAI